MARFLYSQGSEIEIYNGNKFSPPATHQSASSSVQYTRAKHVAIRKKYKLPSFMLNKQGKSSVLHAASTLLYHFPHSTTAPGNVEGWGIVSSSPGTSYRGCQVVLKTASWFTTNLYCFTRIAANLRMGSML